MRRAALQSGGYEVIGLPNIDFVNAALCAVAADAFRNGRYQFFGDQDEGCLLLPVSNDVR